MGQFIQQIWQSRFCLTCNFGYGRVLHYSKNISVFMFCSSIHYFSMLILLMCFHFWTIDFKEFTLCAKDFCWHWMSIDKRELSSSYLNDLFEWIQLYNLRLFPAFSIKSTLFKSQDISCYVSYITYMYVFFFKGKHFDLSLCLLLGVTFV